MVYKKNLEDVFKDLKHIMLDLDFKQSDIALKLGKSTQSINGLFRQKNISLNSLVDICNAMDLDLDIRFLKRDGKV